MITEVPAMTDVCGELEVEHESDVEDFASPPSCLVGIPEDGPSCSAKTTRYTAEKDFGTPNWKKTKRIDFKFGPPDESGVESLKSNIVDSMMCGGALQEHKDGVSFEHGTKYAFAPFQRLKICSFHNKFRIKGVIGAIDCTHVAILSPQSLIAGVVPHEYMNRKGYYSIIVEAVSHSWICNDELIFQNVNARFPGSCHDAGIWTTSPVRVKLIREHILGAFKWLLGDSGYPLEPWLLTPIATPSSASEEIFNKTHIKVKNTIERAFVVLKSRFRCL
ncbi:putative nuclease HARBI1 [Anastrepha obliqua]|uniref:putative nuclease HARBI1 n=1 Tax=Anastrepha obliqua TaxID=95512 RepID=UPI00240A5015|nr:putative nuclease HARBI1 [Anastrepha obliqua]